MDDVLEVTGRAMDPTTLPTSMPAFLTPSAYPPEFWKQYYEDVELSDDQPVENEFQEKQMRLLAASLSALWANENRQFMLYSNVGYFFSPHEPPIAPDIMLVLNVQRIPRTEGKKSEAYFQWEYGKPPDLVMEIVSNRKGDEATRKLKLHERLGVPYYVIYDPDNLLKEGQLRILRLKKGRYEQQESTWLDDINIGLTLWRGDIEGLTDTWLRWCKKDGVLVPSAEMSFIAATAVDQARQAANEARQATEKVRQAEEQVRQAAERTRQVEEQAQQALDQARHEKERARLLEANLLRAGKHVLLIPAAIAREKAGEHDYLTCVNRAQGLRDQFDLYPTRLPERLPRVGIPLKGDDPDVVLDLQTIIEEAYERASYDLRVRYDEPCVPSLGKRQTWANQLIRTSGLVRKKK